MIKILKDIGNLTIVNSIDDTTVEVEFNINANIISKFRPIFKQKLTAMGLKVPAKTNMKLTMRIEKTFNYNRNYKSSYENYGYNDIL